jgi:hypothetical protein
VRAWTAHVLRFKGLHAWSWPVGTETDDLDAVNKVKSAKKRERKAYAVYARVPVRDQHQASRIIHLHKRKNSTHNIHTQHTTVSPPG